MKGKTFFTYRWLKLWFIASVLFTLAKGSSYGQSGEGGTISGINIGGIDYIVHTFTEGGTFVAPAGVTTIEYLVVGGGGGGGGISASSAVGGAGGGGAGQYLSSSSFEIIPFQSYSVTVGSGGLPGVLNLPGTNGGSSSFGPITAIGGGGGASQGNDSGEAGASGGGGRLAGTGGSSTLVGGFVGGDGAGGTSSTAGAGGGGGSAGNGADGVDNTGGVGGAGTSNSITGSSVTYAAGGKGGDYGTPADGASASANTGNGGNGAIGSPTAAIQVGGYGGSGIVIIRYKAVYAYRSKQSGNWNDESTWEIYKGIAWQDADGYPSNSTASAFPFVQNRAVYTNNTTSASHSLTVSSLSPQSGDLILILFRGGGTGAATLPSGYTQLSTRSSNGRSYIWYKVAGPSEGDVTVTTLSNVRSAAIVYVISGWEGIPEAVVASSNVNNPPAITPSWGSDNTLFLALLTNRRTTTTVSAGPSGFTDFITGATGATNNDAYVRASAAILEGTNASLDPLAFIESTTLNSPHSFTVAIRPKKYAALIQSTHTVTVTSNQGCADVIIDGGGTLQINNGVVFTVANGNTVSVLENATLKFVNDGYLNGQGSLFMRSGAYMYVGSANGLTSSGSTGSVQITGSRGYGSAANYVFNRSTGTQNTGDGLGTVNTLTIDNSSGITLSSALNISEGLVLTNGLLTTTTTNIPIVTSPSTSAVSGGTTTSFVKGPLRWTLEATQSYVFPVGVGTTYCPFEIAEVEGSSPVITVQVFSTATAGSVDGGLVTTSSTEYWYASINSGTYSNGRISLMRQLSLGSLDVIARSTASGGPYASLLGLPSGTSILHSILTGNTLGYFRMAQGRLIATGVIAPTTLCPGQSVSVPYTKTHTATGGNVFTAQLSDANGSFINPVSIGSLTTTSNGTISCTIPPGTPTGTGYRIRVVGSIPVVGGTDNGTNLTVNSSVVPPETEGEFICIGAGSQSVTLTASGGVAGDLYNWYNSPSGGTPLQSSSSTTYSPTVSGTTTYYVTIRNTSGCESDLTPVLAGYPPSSNEEQNEPGDGVWKAHVYDGTNFDTYYGSYETAAAAFNESFGGSSACFPISSEYGSQTIQAESFSVRYLMANFPKGLYSVDLGSDDGTKLYVGNDLMCNNWADQSYVVHADVLFAVSEESILKFEYYDNGGGNQVSFESITLILENTLTQNLNQELMLGEVGLAISGDEYGVIPTGIEISGSGYQWTYSLTPDGSRTVIYGAILSTLTPNTALPPFNSPGTYYVRRNGVLLSNNNVNPTLAYATNESNPAVVVVYAGLMDEYRTESSGLWTDPIWQQRHTNDTWSNLGTHPAALSTYTIFPVVKAIATSASTTATMSHTISIPAGVESGDLILIFWEDVSTSTTLGSFSGYTTLVDINSSNMRRKIYYKVANGSEGTSLTVTTSASELSAHVCYLIDAGSYTGTPYISSAHTATSSSPNPPSLSPSGGTGKFVWIPVVLAGEVNTYTAPANYTAVAESHTIYASSSNSHCQVITAFRQYEAATEDPGAFGLGQSALFHSYTLAIRGATITNPKSVATIRDGHTATVNANKNIDYLTINSGGTLLVQNGIGLNVSSGAGLTLETGGKITVAGTGLINGAGLYAQNTGSTLEVGSTSGIASSGATGNIQNTGTRTFSAGAHFVYNGSSAQVTGSGLTQNTPGNLTIDNAAGVTLSAATTISGILTMTAGKLNTTTSNLLYLTNTSVGAVVGGSSTSFVDGPLRRNLPASLVSGSTYTFPVGDVASYLPFALVNPTTGSGTIYTTVEAFTTVPGATMDASLNSLSSDEYWSLAVNGNFTSSSVSITRPTAISPYDVIAGSTAAAGSYTYLGGTSVGTYGISNSLAIGSNRYFRFAKVLYTWDGSSSTDWFTANNWTPAAVPTISSSVLIPSTANKPQISGALAEVIFSTNSSLVMSTGSTLTVNAGSLLKFESPTTVTTNGTAKIILEPSAKYINLSASTPALEVRQLISGNKGWRNVSSPVSNSTYSDMFDNLVTQNFTGSNYPLLQPNLMWWDETNIGTTLQGWRQPTNISNSIASGRGHFHYVFDGAGRLNEDGTDSGSDYPDELPIVMTVNGTEPSLFSSAYTFSPFTYTERDDDPSSQTPSAVDTTFIDINVADAGWNLIGNPTPSTLDWDIAGAWTKTNIDNSIYLWDPATNGGEYLTWNGTIGTLGSGLISPFQAFWVHANAASPVLSFSNAAKSEEESEFYGKSLEISDNLVIPLHLSAQDMTTTSFLSFSESGVIGVDSKDAYRLEPMTKSWIALYMNSSLSHTMPLVINNLSVNIDHEFHVPLYINAMSEGIYTGGDYLLSWELPEAWNADLHLLLMDHGTQSVIDMTQLSSYSFSEQTTKSFAAGSIDPFSLPRKLIESATPSATGGFKSSQNQRFSIVIETKATDSIPVYRKSEPLLLPVVPNPVSESAKLCFRLPEAGQVTLIIYNQIGKIIDVPVSGDFPAGLSEVTWYPNVNESGVYFVKMISGETTKTGRMILVR